MKNWIKYGVIAYGIGIILMAIPSSYQFFLGSYGKGGVPEYRGRMATFDKYFPEDTDYILFNHGNVTPISKDYYDLTQRASSVGNIFCLIAAPFFIFGIVAYASRGLPSKMDPRISFLLTLFIPKRDDPLITFFGKVSFLLTFLCLLADKFIFGHIADEQQFLSALHVMYGAVVAVSFVLALVLRMLVLRRVEKEPNNAINTDQ